MKKYELSYLISPDLSDKEVSNFCEQINSMVQDKGAVFGKISSEKKIKLGYPVKKKVAVFIKTIAFHLNPNRLADLEKELKEKTQILRYFIITQKETKAKEKELVFKTPFKETDLASEKIAEEERVEEKEKVELKDIDEKLREILDE